MNFVLMADELYKKGIDGSLLRCLGQNDQNIALGEVHNGICGAHQAGKKIKWVLYRNHVYWPSMIKDCIDYAKAFLLVEVGQSEIIDFVEEHIIHRFGIPQTLSTDQGTMFTGQRIKSFVASRSINMVTSTPYYAQANGQVEATNKILISLIKKHIENKPRTWHDYNRRIQKKAFNVDELILKVILPMEKKSRFLGKWSHTWEGPFQVIRTYSGNAYQIKDIESGRIINSVNGKY
ncbi:uncharacterized protein [Arachis hypogaea]|uniref:uncharacterized protein n=1 Tax=Arachis hypogaea TaxID=3818 RepID=UPI0007AF6204